MQFSQLKEIETSLKAIHGDPTQFDISGISHSDSPLKKTFIFIRSKKYLAEIGSRSKETSFLNSGIIIEEKVSDLLEVDEFKGVVGKFAWIATIESVSAGMCSLTKPFYDKLYGELNYQVDGRQLSDTQIDPSAQISQTVFIGSNVKIGKNTKIMPGCVILPNTTIGEDSIIFPNVTVYPYCSIGDRCRVHAGTVIGCDGFGYNLIDGEHKKIWHLYGVVIEDEVEIGSNANIDNGAFIETRIGFRSRIDNDVQISHNVHILSLIHI